MIEINMMDKTAKISLTQALKEKLDKNCVIVCIGTEKVISDSLGPQVGTLLNENLQKPLFVYGMENNNITAENLSQSLEIIKKLHPKHKLLVIDAAVGEQSQIGCVQIVDGAILPGAATNKKLEKIGDVSIVGIVANKDMSDFYSRTIAKSQLVKGLSQFIATCIVMATK